MFHIFQKYTFIITIMGKDLSKNSENKRSGEKENRMYETYKNTVIPHGIHIDAKEYDMANAKICAYPQSDHALPHWKCVI